MFLVFIYREIISLYLLPQAHEEVIRFHIAMNEVFSMNEFNTADLHQMELLDRKY